MGRRKIKVRNRPAGPPSKFFMVALAVGVALVLLIFIQVLRNPQKPAPATTTSSSR